MDWLTPDRYLSAMESETARLVAAVDGRDPAGRIPTCPGWTLHDLVSHVGTGHRLSAAVVRAEAAKPSPYAVIEAPDDDWNAWLTEGSAALIGAGETLRFNDWLVTLTPDGATWGIGTGPADVEYHAADLEVLLVLNRRRAPGESLGDRALLDRWLENTKF